MGYVITIARRAVCTFADKRCGKAGAAADKAAMAPMQAGKKSKAVKVKVIPTAIYGMQWASPAKAAGAAVQGPRLWYAVGALLQSCAARR